MQSKQRIFRALSVLALVFLIAGFAGSAAPVTHYCDVDDFRIEIRAPNTQTQTYSGFSFDSQSGGCSVGNPRLEKWLNSNEKYKFCPMAGQYQGRTRAHMQQSGGGYSWDSWSGWSNIYTVDYDGVQEWCDCGKNTGLGYEWFDSVSQGTTGNCCGDDSTSDYFEFEGFGNPCCISGAKKPDREVEATWYLCGDGQIFVCSLATTEGFDTEVSIWDDAVDHCCTPSGWEFGPCPRLSITDVRAKYVEADDDVNVFVECYRSAVPNTTELVDIEIAKKDEPGVTLFFSQLTCGQEVQFDTTGSIVDDALYLVHAQFHNPTDCDNCEGIGYFAKSTQVEIQSPELPMAFAVVIAAAVIFVARRRQTAAGKSAEK